VNADSFSRYAHRRPNAVAEYVVLQPIQRELLAPEAVERACELLRGWARDERVRGEEGISPAAAAIGAEIADLEDLIQSRPARAATRSGAALPVE
jgi:hypothetical protein